MNRAIIRWSVNGEATNATGKAVTKGLTDAGFGRVGTASYEHQGGEQDDVLDALSAAIEKLRNPPGGGTLDHLWVYVDSPEYE